MHSPWKKFWLELFTSKTWEHGNSIGRLLWNWIGADVVILVVMAYRLIFKDEELSRAYHFLGVLARINLVILAAFFLLVLHSIVKEQRGKEFLRLLAGSLNNRN